MTDRQKKFIREYCKHLNASKAARNAGYSIRCAAQIGYENLRKPNISGPIRAHIDKRRREIDKILDDRMRNSMRGFFKSLSNL